MTCDCSRMQYEKSPDRWATTDTTDLLAYPVVAVDPHREFGIPGRLAQVNRWTGFHWKDGRGVPQPGSSLSNKNSRNFHEASPFCTTCLHYCGSHAIELVGSCLLSTTCPRTNTVLR